jgi:hypothetical protein
MPNRGVYLTCSGRAMKDLLDYADAKLSAMLGLTQGNVYKTSFPGGGAAPNLDAGWVKEGQKTSDRLMVLVGHAGCNNGTLPDLRANARYLREADPTLTVFAFWLISLDSFQTYQPELVLEEGQSDSEDCYPLFLPLITEILRAHGNRMNNVDFCGYWLWLAAPTEAVHQAISKRLILSDNKDIWLPS